MNLANPKHEQFARALARGASAEDAGVQAGFKNMTATQARALASKSEICKRVNELVQESEEKLAGYLEYTLEAFNDMDPDKLRLLITENYIIKELIVSIKMSQAAGQFNATKALIELLGKELGMFGGNGSKSMDDPTGQITNNQTNNIINVLANMPEIQAMTAEMVDITPVSRLKTKKIAVDG